MALRVLVNPRDEVIIPVPSFVCYGPLTEMAGGVPVYVELTAENVFVDTVKPAEDGSGDVILRLYEAKRADTACELALRLPISSAQVCDMLENPVEDLDLSAGALRLHFHPFEVKTLRLRP